MWISNDLDTIHFLLDNKGWGKRIKDDEGKDLPQEDVKNVIPISARQIKQLSKKLQNASKTEPKLLNNVQSYNSWFPHF